MVPVQVAAGLEHGAAERPLEPRAPFCGLVLASALTLAVLAVHIYDGFASCLHSYRLGHLRE